MTNVIQFPQRTRIVTDQHRRIAEKITELVRRAIPDADNIHVESIETICVCGYRDVYGDSICERCPENPNPPPEDAA